MPDSVGVREADPVKDPEVDKDADPDWLGDIVGVGLPVEVGVCAWDDVSVILGEPVNEGLLDKVGDCVTDSVANWLLVADSEAVRVWLELCVEVVVSDELVDLLSDIVKVALDVTDCDGDKVVLRVIDCEVLEDSDGEGDALRLLVVVRVNDWLIEGVWDALRDWVVLRVPDDETDGVPEDVEVGEGVNEWLPVLETLGVSLSDSVDDDDGVVD